MPEYTGKHIDASDTLPEVMHIFVLWYSNLHRSFQIEIKKRLQKEYIKPVQLRVINVMRHWIDYHFDDFEKETELVSIMSGFFDE